jgi:hypothetical protein
MPESYVIATTCATEGAARKSNNTTCQLPFRDYSSPSSAMLFEAVIKQCSYSLKDRMQRSSLPSVAGVRNSNLLLHFSKPREYKSATA